MGTTKDKTHENNQQYSAPIYVHNVDWYIALVHGDQTYVNLRYDNEHLRSVIIKKIWNHGLETKEGNRNNTRMEILVTDIRMLATQPRRLNFTCIHLPQPVKQK